MLIIEAIQCNNVYSDIMLANMFNIDNISLVCIGVWVLLILVIGGLVFHIVTYHAPLILTVHAYAHLTILHS